MKNFLKNTKAATAVEFAIILPVLLLLLLGIIQFGLTIFFDSSLNAGIRAAAREGVGHGYQDAEDINKIMKANLGGLYDPAEASLIMFTYNSFNNPQFAIDRDVFLNNPDNFFDAYGTGPDVSQNQSGQIVVYGVKYHWGQTFGIRNPFLPRDLYSFSIVRNETFN